MHDLILDQSLLAKDAIWIIVNDRMIAFMQHMKLCNRPLRAVCQLYFPLYLTDAFWNMRWWRSTRFWCSVNQSLKWRCVLPKCENETPMYWPALLVYCFNTLRAGGIYMCQWPGSPLVSVVPWFNACFMPTHYSNKYWFDVNFITRAHCM